LLRATACGVKKKVICEIFSRTGYFVLKFAIKVNFIKIVVHVRPYSYNRYYSRLEERWVLEFLKRTAADQVAPKIERPHPYSRQFEGVPTKNGRKTVGPSYTSAALVRTATHSWFSTFSIIAWCNFFFFIPDGAV
jgi:hypothetical protein